MLKLIWICIMLAIIVLAFINIVYPLLVPKYRFFFMFRHDDLYKEYEKDVFEKKRNLHIKELRDDSFELRRKEKEQSLNQESNNDRT